MRLLALALLLLPLSASAGSWWLGENTGGSSVPNSVTPAIPHVSVTGPASLVFSNADVQQTTADQINVVGHGFTTGDGPYELSSTGTTGYAAAGWLYGEEVWIIRISDDEFQLTDTLGGAAHDITAHGDGTHTLTKLTESENFAVASFEGTDGTKFHTHANPCTQTAAGTLRCTSQRAATFFSTENHPNPGIGQTENGFSMGGVTSAMGSPFQAPATIIRLVSRNFYPSIVGDIGGGAASTNTVRILHSHATATRMVSPTTVVVSTPSQDTGTEICSFDALTCVFVEETVAPVDGVASAWTWQACADDLTDGRWARAYCSTVTDP